VPVTVVEPGVEPVKVTAQLVRLVEPDRVQVAELREPTALFDNVKLTEPVGAVGVGEVSVTVAVQVEVRPMLIEARLQATLVVVLSLGVAVTVIVAATLTLPL